MIDELEDPFGYPTKRIVDMRRPVVAIALLREWVSLKDMMVELQCRQRAAKNLILWARVHWYVRCRTNPAKAERDPMRTRAREYKLASPDRRPRPLGACAFACCRDARGDRGVVIYTAKSSVHMWPSAVPERSRRSAVMTTPGAWFLVGRNAPEGAVSMDDAVLWVSGDARSSDGPPYAATHDNDRERRATRYVGLPAVVAREAGQRLAPR